MATTDIEPSELTKWDPGLTERVMGIIRPFLKRYFRSEVRGLENMPPGGALLVSNHSGGMLPMDVPILAADFYEQARLRPAALHAEPRHAADRADRATSSSKIGYISANHENADEALRSGGLVVVFPGGDYDVYRPTLSENKIDFGGRTGYVKAALNAGRADRARRSASAARRPSSSSPAGPGWPSASGRSHGWRAPRSCRSRSASRSA